MARTDTRPSWAGIMFFLSILMFLIAKAVAGLLIGSIISALLLPPSLVLYYITSLAQTSRKRADSKGIAEFRRGLADYIAAGFFSMCITSLELLLIFKLSPGLKHRNIYDQPISKWAAVSTIICIFGYCTMKVRLHVYEWLEPRNVSDDRFHLREGLTGLINCGLILSAELSVNRVVPVLKQTTILDLQARKWVHVILIALLSHNAIRVITSLAVGRLRAYCENTSGEEKHEPEPEPSPRLAQADSSKEKEKKDGAWLNRLAKAKKIGDKYLENPEEMKKISAVDFLLPNKKTRDRVEKYVVYFSEGLSRSVNFLVTTLLFLLTWTFYFGSRLNRNSASIREAYDYITWTLVCVFVISIFWLVKDAIVLSWEARVVYKKFHNEISEWSTHLWLLGILAGRELDILNIDWDKRHERLDQDNKSGPTNTAVDGDGEEQHNIESGDEQRDDHSKRLDEDKPETKAQRQGGPLTKTAFWASLFVVAVIFSCLAIISLITKIKKTPHKHARPEAEAEARKILVYNQKKLGRPSHKEDQDLPAHIIMGKAAYFLAAEASLSKKNYVLYFRNKWDEVNKRSKLNNNNPPIKDLDSEEIENDDFVELKKAVGGISPNYSFDNWIERAHKSSLALARSLSGAKEVVDSLNQIIAWLIIGVMIVVWLLLTGIATTKVFVLVASPVLAASFIFGDTCKTFFQGIMFAYVLHPFTVGDRCTIGDSTEMEVMRIGIWSTIFSKVGFMGEEVLYPNSVLATKPIINHKSIDPDDYVEFSRNTSNGGSQIDDLKGQLEVHVKRLVELHPIKLRCPGVVAERVGGNIKVGIHFKHDAMKFSDMLSTEIHESKHKMKEMLEQYIRSCLDYHC